jgi:hypothetical protein
MHRFPLLLSVTLHVALATLCSPQLSAQSAPSSATAAGAKFEQRVTVEAVRNRRTRIEGGDFDDKRDQISFTLKFANGDTRTAFKDCKAEFYVFAESILNRKAFQLLGIEKFDLSLEPRGTASVGTAEWETRWDTTGARFGTKYDSWVLVVWDQAGAVIFKKASTPPWLPVAEKMHTLSQGTFYDRSLKPINGLR